MYEIVFNFDTLTPALRRLSEGLGDMTPVMGAIADAWLQNTQDRMLRGEQPDGQAFAPRSPVTLEQYAASGFGAFAAVPLFRKGWMRDDLFPQYGSDFASINSNALQAAVMQFGAEQGAFGQTSRGAPIPWGDIPARPFLGVSDDDERMFIEELEEWLAGAAEG